MPPPRLQIYLRPCLTLTFASQLLRHNGLSGLSKFVRSFSRHLGEMDFCDLFQPCVTLDLLPIR